jgi:outer membrane protein insertion porin family
MKKISLILIVSGLWSFGSAVVAQDARPYTIVRPCNDEESPGRPTLKRRQPEKDDHPSAADINEKVDEAKPCDPVRKESESDNRPATIYFEGLKAVSESDLLKLLRERAKLANNSVPEFGVVKEAEEAIKQFLVERGYRHAAVSSRIENPDNKQAAVTFIISEGPHFKIAEIRFEGNRIFSSQLLAEEMKNYLAGYEKAREGYNEDVFDFCLYRLNNFIRGQGYLQANFRDRKIEESNDGLIITVSGSEGPLYRLGRMRIEGPSLLFPEQIIAMFGQKTGDIVNGERLSKFVFEELKQYYGERGYIQYTAEITPEFNVRPGRSDGVVDLEITIEEGPRFKIRKIGFSGEKLPQTDLRELLLVRGGDVYSQKLFEQSIDRLNDLGWFEFVDKDKDVDYRTNEEEHLVDIVIKLTKKADS